MCFRVAVRAIESWLLADREGLAHYLRIGRSIVPADPDNLLDPKGTVIELARRSRKRDIREDMSPRPGSGRRVGPAYTSRLIEFVEDRDNGWRPDVAVGASDSLRRCIVGIRELISR